MQNWKWLLVFIIVRVKAAINVQVKLMHSELVDRAYSSQLV